MAKYLFGVTPIDGHVAPLLSIAGRLVGRGHHVRVLTGRRFRNAVDAVGATHVPLPEAADYDIRDLDASFPERRNKKGFGRVRYDIEHLFLRVIPDQFRAVEDEISNHRPAAIVVDHVFGGAAVLVTGNPLWADRPPVVSVGIGPLSMSSRDLAPAGLGLPPLAGPAGRVRNGLLSLLSRRVLFSKHEKLARQLANGLGAPPVPHTLFDWPKLAEQHLQLTVPAFEYPRSDLPVNVTFTGPVLPQMTATEPPSWWPDLDSARAVVLVTQGTLDNDNLGRLVIPTLHGLAGDDVLVVAVTGGPPVSTLGPLPSNARAEVFVPFGELIDKVDVFVTNGGYGGVQFALRHGVPLVVAGTTEDKPEIAARVAWVGAGVNLRTSNPKPEAVAAAVRTLLSESRYRDRARSIAKQMPPEDGAQVAADRIEQASVAANTHA